MRDHRLAERMNYGTLKKLDFLHTCSDASGKSDMDGDDKQLFFMGP